MSRIRMMQMSLVATLIVGMIASKPAFAIPEYLIEMIPVNKAVEASGNASRAFLNTRVNGVNGIEIQVECTTNTFSEGKFEKMGESVGKLSYTGCSLYRIAFGTHTPVNTCTVPNFAFNVDDQLFLKPGGVTAEDEFKPSAGNTFVEIEFAGVNCPMEFRGKYKLEGRTDTTFDFNIQRELVHEIFFTGQGSLLRFGNATTPNVRAGAQLFMGIVQVEAAKKPWYVRP